MIFAALSFTSCAPSTESSGWLKGTTWKADVAGDNGEGYIKIHFYAIGGYKLDIHTNESETHLVTTMSPDYDFPTLYFPIEWDVEDDKPVNVIYNTGTFSEDFKTLHFDTFRDRSFKIGDSSYYKEYKDIDFIRK